MATRLLRFTWILLVVIAVLLLSCTDNLLGKMKSNIQVSLDIPEVPRSRNVSTSLNLNLKVKGWVQDKQGEVLDLVEKTLENGRAVLSFNTVDFGLEVQILIQVSDTSQVLYSGRSDFFEVSPEGNTVSVDLKRGDFSSEEVTGPAGDGGKDDPAGSDGPPSDGGEDAPAGSDGPTSDGEEDAPAGSDGPPSDGGEDAPAGSDGPPSDGGDDEPAGDGGPVGTVEVNFTVLKSDWEGLVNFPSNDLVIRGAMMGADGSSSSEYFVGDFGANTITFSNIPAETEVTAYAVVYYNPQQKYSYEEVAPADGSSLKYLLHMNSSTSFLVKEGTNTVDIVLTPYDMGGIAQNGYTHLCSSQEEIEDVIEYATDSVILSLAEDVHITDTITIDKEVSFMHLGDIIDIHVLPSLFWENSAGPMFEVTSTGNLSLLGIILDGCYMTQESTNPAITSEGTLFLDACELRNNKISSNNAVVYINSGTLSISGTNISGDENSGGNALYLEAGVNYRINNQNVTSETDLSYEAITAESF